MGNLIVIIVVAFTLFLAIRPIIKHNKNKGISNNKNFIKVKNIF